MTNDLPMEMGIIKCIGCIYLICTVFTLFNATLPAYYSLWQRRFLQSEDRRASLLPAWFQAALLAVNILWLLSISGYFVSSFHPLQDFVITASLGWDWSIFAITYLRHTLPRRSLQLDCNCVALATGAALCLAQWLGNMELTQPCLWVYVFLVDLHGAGTYFTICACLGIPLWYWEEEEEEEENGEGREKCVETEEDMDLIGAGVNTTNAEETSPATVEP